jgi:hypothetical protein
LCNEYDGETMKELRGRRASIVYFDEGGRHNSQATYELARERAVELGIKKVVIASIRGQSVPEMLTAFEGSDIRIYFASCDACNGCPRFDLEMKADLEAVGHQLIYANEHDYPYPPEAELSYRRMCEGMKVVVHLAIAVAEDGIIPPGEEFIAIAGTGWKQYEPGGGSDTAVVIESTLAKDYWSYPPTMGEHKLTGRRIKEIICMPR